MRVFAGPNGSGKSSVIEYVKKQKVEGFPIDFGIYVNADDIARSLREDTFTFSKYEIDVSNKEFHAIALASGLINAQFTDEQFNSCYTFSNGKIKLKPLSAKKVNINNPDERIAQVLAHVIREYLLMLKKKFSFETVLSHESKLDIMRRASDAGYKVYLYFVSTESAEINKFRVKARKQKGGHDVPPLTIEKRYTHSMQLLYEASQLAYQAFYFDNSVDDEDFTMFAHFKKQKNNKIWDKLDPKYLPDWFIEYYYNKQT